MSFYQASVFSGYLSGVIAITLLVYKAIVKKEQLPTPIIIFIILLVFGAIFDFIGQILISRTGTNYIQLNVYYLVDFTLSLSLFSFWTESFSFQRLIRWGIIPVYILIWIIVKILGMESLNEMNTMTNLVRILILFTIGLNSLYYLSKKSIKKLWCDHEWVICKTLITIYFNSFVVKDISMYIWNKYKILNPWVGVIYLSINTLTQLAFIYALILYGKKSDEKMNLPSNYSEIFERVKQRMKKER